METDDLKVNINTDSPNDDTLNKNSSDTDSPKRNSKTVQFIIVLGDEGEVFLNRIRDKLEVVFDSIKQNGWTLYQSDTELYWYITNKVVNLNNQFMIFNNPKIYYIVNYGIQLHFKILEKCHKLVEHSFKKDYPEELVVIGMNYHKKMENNRRIVEKWCKDHDIRYIDIDSV